MDAVDTWLATYPDSPVVLDVLGTTDAEEIRARARAAEPELEEIFYFSMSVGALFGARRRDGLRVAIKVNKLFDDPAYLADVQRVQVALRAVGLPAPRPVRLVGATTVDEWLEDGVFRNAHEAEVRRAMAETLARFIEAATASGLRPHRPFLRPEGALWPKPHNALFDFEATAAGAEWIDEIGARASPPRLGREVVGHTDWAAKHLRFDDDLRPTAIYDWDSVTTESEPVIVGTAAGAHVYTEELGPDVRRWPTPAEASAFVDDYERARGPFTRAERRLAEASCVYLMAYGARCHHAVGGDATDILADFAEAFRI